jgi:hypothetical protein
MGETNFPLAGKETTPRVPGWEKQTIPGLTGKHSFWLGKRTPPEMGEANFSLAGKKTTSRLGETNSMAGTKLVLPESQTKKSRFG